MRTGERGEAISPYLLRKGHEKLSDSVPFIFLMFMCLAYISKGSVFYNCS